MGNTIQDKRQKEANDFIMNTGGRELRKNGDDPKKARKTPIKKTKTEPRSTATCGGSGITQLACDKKARNLGGAQVCQGRQKTVLQGETEKRS